MPAFVDITGQQFGMWKVLEYVGNSKWLCECQCENKTRREVLGKTLRNGTSKSCGCLNRVNIDGKTFGNWLVIKQLSHDRAQCKCKLCDEIYTVKIGNLKSGSSTQCIKCSAKNQKHSYEDLSTQIFGMWKPLEYQGYQKWLCECQCENKTQKIIAAADLKRGSTKSCGCIQFRDLTKEETNASIIRYIGHGYWECKCNNCGKICNIYRTDILNGKDDCGCLAIEKRLSTLIDKYGDFSTSKIGKPRTLEQQYAVINRDNLENFIQSNFNYKPSIYELSTKLDLSADRALKLTHKYGLEHLININAGSHFEEEIYNELLDICTDSSINRHNRIILKPKELDFYISGKKIAIEFNGNYWHSAAIIDKHTHQQKTIDCAKQGIQLIHIFEYEWVNNKNKIINLLKNKMHKNENIYARNTVVDIINRDEAKKFCNNNHLQNYVSSVINIGCKYNNKLIGVLSISKPRFNNNYQYEITRLCWSKNVVGGTEKLFSYFLKNYNPTSIITYTDISKFTGNVYTRLGFKPIQPNPITEPNYVWVHLKKNIVLTRYQTQKHILVENGVGTIEQTENEIMESLGFFKIYDSGNLRLEWLKGEQ